MGFLDKAKAAAEQAKVKAQEGVEQVQAKKETTQAYWDLGHKAYQLASSGAISHPELDPLVKRISELEAGDGGTPGSATDGETPGSATDGETPGSAADAGTPGSAAETPPAETWAPTETAT